MTALVLSCRGSPVLPGLCAASWFSLSGECVRVRECGPSRVCPNPEWAVVGSPCLRQCTPGLSSVFEVHLGRLDFSCSAAPVFSNNGRVETWLFPVFCRHKQAGEKDWPAICGARRRAAPERGLAGCRACAAP